MACNALDKWEVYIIFSYFSTKNICCGYSLDAPSNEYSKHMISRKKKKKKKKNKKKKI